MLKIVIEEVNPSPPKAGDICRLKKRDSIFKDAFYLCTESDPSRNFPIFINLNGDGIWDTQYDASEKFEVVDATLVVRL